MRTSRPGRPPLNGAALLAARLRKGLTQDEVQEQCAARGRPVYNLGRMENGEIRWPTPRIFPVLAEVLGLDVCDLLASSTSQPAKKAA